MLLLLLRVDNNSNANVLVCLSFKNLRKQKKNNTHEIQKHVWQIVLMVMTMMTIAMIII